ncbi:MAG TPA: hypothetical protein VGQ39_24575 [Pyrinomonadaceae bacterium]|jgi:hypothetical protein|nr:hypothetical protein [Pyrinomonadaceae bacterium]
MQYGGQRHGGPFFEAVVAVMVEMPGGATRLPVVAVGPTDKRDKAQWLLALWLRVMTTAMVRCRQQQ